MLRQRHELMVKQEIAKIVRLTVPDSMPYDEFIQLMEARINNLHTKIEAL